MKRLACALSLVLAVGAIVAIGLPPAGATFPGSNGEIAYFTGLGGLRAIQPNGSGDHPLRVGLRSDAFAYSPDGTQAVVAQGLKNTGVVTDRLVLVDLGTGDRTLVLAAKDLPRPGIYSVAMSPDGSSIVLCDGFSPSFLFTVGIDGTGLKRLPSTRNYCYADWGTNDRIVAQQGIFPGEGIRKVTAMDPDGGNQVDIATFPDAKAGWRTIYVIVPRWAPDGSSVVFTAQRHLIHPDIWAVDADGSNLRKLTHTKLLSESGPVYSPDGTQVVFTIDADLWLMGADGSGRTRLTQTARLEYSTGWQST